MPVSDKYGSLSVNTEGTKPTYRVALLAFSPAATPTDIFTLTGSATTTVKINNIKINCDATAAGAIDVYLIKRSAANTGGTATASTITKMDSNDVAPTAVASQYSANPTGLGTGTIFSGDRLATPNAATTGYPMFPYHFDFDNSKSITLRGTSEIFAINLNGAAMPTGTKFYITVEWTEEV